MNSALALSLLLCTVATAQERKPVTVPNSPPTAADWSGRDLESRWSLWSSAPTEDPEVRRAWIDSLVQQRDHELLEWIVISEDTGWLDAAQTLVDAGDSRWMRAAVLALDSGDSHNREGTSKSLRENRGQFLGWLARFPQARTGTAARLADEFEREGIVLVGALDQLGPATVEELYGPLARALKDAPVPLGERHAAEPGVLYESMVERSIRVAQARTRPSDDVLALLLGVAESSHESLAVSSCLAFTHFPQDAVPGMRLFALAWDVERSLALREAAYLAGTYGPDAQAYGRLHSSLVEENVELRAVVMSRLGDLGDRFTLTLLDPDSQEPEVLQLRDVLEQRGVEKGAWTEATVRRSLLRAAFADVRCLAVEGRLAKWVLGELRVELEGNQGTEMRAWLEGVSEDPVGGWTLPEMDFGGDPVQRVREYVAGLLE